MAQTPELSSIRVERRGGLAGLRASAELAAADLSAPQRAAAAKLLAVASAPASAQRASPPAGADRYSYRVHLRTADGAEQVFDFGEDDLPSAFAGLAKPQLP